MVVSPRIDGKMHQGVHRNQEGQHVGDDGVDQGVHDCADDKTNKAHLKIKQEGDSADGKG